jgi:RNA polymerase sigma-70 factor, ECF subfamily
MIEDHSLYLQRLTLLQKPMRDQVLKEVMSHVFHEMLESSEIQEIRLKKGVEHLESGNFLDEPALMEAFKECLVALTPVFHFEEFTDSYRPLLYKLAMQILGNHQSAEDVVQESLMNAYLALTKYSMQQLKTLRFKSWLCTIVRNTAFNYRAKERRFELLYLSEDSDFLEMEANRFEQPEVALLIDEAAQEFRQLLRRLPQQYRAAILLRFTQDWDYKSLAEAMNMSSMGTLKSYIHRSITLMRKVAENLGIQERDWELWAQGCCLSEYFIPIPTNTELSREKSKSSNSSNEWDIDEQDLP